MSQIKSVNTINREIDRLNTQYEKMVAASESFLAFMFTPDLFNAYSEYHSLLTNFTNSLITKNPVLPNNSVADSNPLLPPKQHSGTAELAMLLQNNGKSLIEGLVLLGSIVAITVLAALRIVPYIIPVIWVIIGPILFFAPNLLSIVAEQLKRKDEEELDVDTANPSEWIGKELQIMGDKYDAIRILIIKQDTNTERLASRYSKKNLALYSRAEHEKQFFPNECLTVVRKIMVFCTNSYYEIKDDLISHLPVSNVPNSPQPQFQGMPQ